MATVPGIELESRRVDAILNDLGGRISNTMISTALITVHGHFLNRSIRMFRTETDPWGNKWAPLADSTVAFRDSMGFGGAHPINVRTGGLRESLTGAPPDILGHSDGAVTLAYPSRKTPDRELMVKHKQAAGQLRGPARPVIGMNEKDVAFVLSVLNSSLFSALGRSR